MGWNSWDGFQNLVTEAQVRQQADFMAANLKTHGWQYIVVDYQWYLPTVPDKDGHTGAKLANSTAKYVAIFNLQDAVAGADTSGNSVVPIRLADLGIPAQAHVRDLWTKQDLPDVQTTFQTKVPPHGARLFRLTPVSR